MNTLVGIETFWKLYFFFIIKPYPRIFAVEKKILITTLRTKFNIFEIYIIVHQGKQLSPAIRMEKVANKAETCSFNVESGNWQRITGKRYNMKLFRRLSFNLLFTILSSSNCMSSFEYLFHKPSLLEKLIY